MTNLNLLKKKLNQQGNRSIFVNKFSFHCFTIYEITMVCPQTLIGKTKNIEKIVSLLC